MTADELRHLLAPHIQGILDSIAGREVYLQRFHCHEGTNHCGNAPLDFDTDDIVFLRDLDENAITFNPSHRACAANEWGAEHLLPATRYAPLIGSHAGWPA